MATLQYLTNKQIDEAIQAAAERQVPVTITVRLDSGWANYHSRVITVREGHLWLDLPRSEEEGGPPHTFGPAEKIGVSFKLKHHKHTFTGTVAQVSRCALDDGTQADVLQVCSPTRMHRMQRRAFFRAEVPPNRIVRASFWLGGREAEPAGTSPDRPVWSGRVTNLSAGGFQVLMSEDLGEPLEVGETIGVRIIFGAGEETVYADAQFRHVDKTTGDIYVGFQFVGLAQSPEGRKALQLIGSKATEYHRDSAGSHPHKH